jgi:hypothetical protein
MEKAVMERRHPRYPFAIPVICRSLSYQRHIEVGMTRNVSLGGVMLDTPSLFSPQTPLEVRLMMGDRVIRASAVVAWSVPIGTDFRHGLSFTDFPSEDQALWKKLMAYQAGPTPRASIRIPVEVPAECHPCGETHRLIQGGIDAIGEEGLLVWLPELFPVETRLSIQVPSGHGTSSVEGEVVWVVEKKPNQFVPHGVRFCSDHLERDLFIAAVLLQEFLRRSAVEIPTGRAH